MDEPLRGWWFKSHEPLGEGVKKTHSCGHKRRIQLVYFSDRTTKRLVVQNPGATREGVKNTHSCGHKRRIQLVYFGDRTTKRLVVRSRSH